MRVASNLSSRLGRSLRNLSNLSRTTDIFINDKTRDTGVLNLWNQGITGAKFLAFMGELANNPGVVQELSFGYNNITLEEVRVLANFLKSDKGIKEVILSGNQIGDEGAIVLADALNEDISLRRMTLNSNEIGKRGGEAIIDLIRKNTPLEFLSLYHNPVLSLDSFFYDLIEAIPHNTHLKCLDICPNSAKRDARGDYPSNAPEYRILKKIAKTMENSSANLGCIAVGFTSGNDKHWSTASDCINIHNPNTKPLERFVENHEFILLGRVLRKIYEKNQESLHPTAHQILVETLQKETKKILLNGLTNEEILNLTSPKPDSFFKKLFKRSLPQKTGQKLLPTSGSTQEQEQTHDSESFRDYSKAKFNQTINPLNDEEFFMAIDATKRNLENRPGYITKIGRNFSKLLDDMTLDIEIDAEGRLVFDRKIRVVYYPTHLPALVKTKATSVEEITLELPSKTITGTQDTRLPEPLSPKSQGRTN